MTPSTPPPVMTNSTPFTRDTPTPATRSRRQRIGLALALLASWTPSSPVLAAPSRAKKASSSAKGNVGAQTSPQKREPTPPEQSASAHSTAVLQAEALYNAGQYIEAAQAFEALEVRSARYLYYAGLAREALGHDALAIYLWMKVIAAFEVDEDLRAQARARRERAQARTTRLMISVNPPRAALGARVELEYEGPASRPKLVLSSEQLVEGVYLEPGPWSLRMENPGRDFEPGRMEFTVDVQQPELRVALTLVPRTHALTLTFAPTAALSRGLRLTLRSSDQTGVPEVLEIHRQRHALRLPSGRWTYRAEAPGWLPAEGELDVRTDGLREHPITLDPRRKPRRPSDLRPLALGTGITGALIGAAAGATIAWSEWKITSPERLHGCNAASGYLSGCTTPALDSIQSASVVAGASLGLLMTAAVAAAPNWRVRRRVWATTAILGGIVATVGAAWGVTWLTQTWRPDHLAHHDQTPSTMSRHELNLYRSHVYPTMGMAGLGGALFIGSITGMVLERSRARDRRTYSNKPRLRTTVPFAIDF